MNVKKKNFKKHLQNGFGKKNYRLGLIQNKEVKEKVSEQKNHILMFNSIIMN